MPNRPATETCSATAASTKRASARVIGGTCRTATPAKKKDPPHRSPSETSSSHADADMVWLGEEDIGDPRWQAMISRRWPALRPPEIHRHGKRAFEFAQ